MSEQLQREPSHGEPVLSSPTPEQLRAWRVYFDCSLAIFDVLEVEMERDSQMTFLTYGVLIHIEDEPDGLRMNELADRILYSRSGLTRVVDRLERDGYVRRVRPETDRRSIFVVLTDEGRRAMERARIQHRHGIEQHFARHLTDADIAALTTTFEKLREHLRPLRPGRIRG